MSVYGVDTPSLIQSPLGLGEMRTTLCQLIYRQWVYIVVLEPGVRDGQPEGSFPAFWLAHAYGTYLPADGRAAHDDWAANFACADGVGLCRLVRQAVKTRTDAWWDRDTDADHRADLEAWCRRVRAADAADVQSRLRSGQGIEPGLN